MEKDSCSSNRQHSRLSVYGIGVANNGGGTDGQEYTFDAISVSSGDDILVVRSVSAMSSYFDLVTLSLTMCY